MNLSYRKGEEPIRREATGSQTAAASRRQFLLASGTAAGAFSKGKTASAASANADRKSPRWIPNDPLFPQQWGLEVVRAPEAWTIARGDPDVVIAIIERGFNFNHPDLRNKWVHAAKWLDPEDPRVGAYSTGHGTHVAGIAAAETNNGIGMAGVAPDCKVMPIACQAWDEVVLARAIRYAADRGARVINMSYAHVDYEVLNPASKPAPYRRNRLGIPETDELMEAVEYAESRGVLLCRGLTDNGVWNSMLYPGYYSHIINVGTTDRHGRRSDTTGYGDGLDVLAPSGWRGGHPEPGAGLPEDAPPEAAWQESTAPYGTLSAGNGNEYYLQSGNCQAVPYVAGVAALVFSRHPGWSPLQVRQVILNTARGRGWNPYFGHGLLDAYEAVKVDRFETELEIVDAAVAPKEGYFEVTATIANRGAQDARRIPVILFNDMPNGNSRGVELGYRLIDVRGFEQEQVSLRFALAEDGAHPVVMVDPMRMRSARQLREGTRYLFRHIVTQAAPEAPKHA
jgi:thermitase